MNFPPEQDNGLSGLTSLNRNNVEQWKICTVQKYDGAHTVGLNSQLTSMYPDTLIHSATTPPHCNHCHNKRYIWFTHFCFFAQMHNIVSVWMYSQSMLLRKIFFFISSPKLQQPNGGERKIKSRHQRNIYIQRIQTHKVDLNYCCFLPPPPTNVINLLLFSFLSFSFFFDKLSFMLSLTINTHNLSYFSQPEMLD